MNQTKTDDSNTSNSYKIIKENSNMLKNNIFYFKKEISMALIVLCVVIILFSIYGFTKNNEHDGLPAMVMSSVSYITTTAALITALLFLV